MHIILVGDGATAAGLWRTLSQHHFHVSVITDISLLNVEATLPVLLLVVLEDEQTVATVGPYIQRHNLRWIAWVLAREAYQEIIVAAYQAGSLAVLPAVTPTELILSLVQNLTKLLSPVSPSTLTVNEEGRIYKYALGDFIPTESDSVLKVKEGIVEMHTIHTDGTKALLGLYGPSQMVMGYWNGRDHIQLVAHTNTTITKQKWGEAVQDAHFSQHLQTYIAQVQAWAAAQAQPRIEQRLLEILTLLARLFGRPHVDGTLIDVRLTHELLATAVGCSRTTMTRILGNLRKQDRLGMVQTAQGERFCLYQ